VAGITNKIGEVKMNKVKIFKERPESVEMSVNRWLESKEVEIIHVAQSVVNAEITMAIFYREIEERRPSVF
jgi:hypothetical protein